MMFELNVKCRRMNEVSSNDTNLLYIHHTPSLPPLPSDSSTCLLRKKQARHPGMNPSLQVRSQSMRKHPIVSEPVTPVSPAYPPLHTHVPQKSRRTKEPQPPTPPHPRMESCPGQVLASNRHGLQHLPSHWAQADLTYIHPENPFGAEAKKVPQRFHSIA